MHVSGILRLPFYLILAVLLGACANTPPQVLATVTPASSAAIVALPRVLAEPQRWSGQELNLIAPVQVSDDERLLTATLTDTSASRSNSEGIWLAQPLPEAVRNNLQDGRGILKLRGTLSPPGAYGRDQQLPYQFTATTSEVLQPESTTIANLALNPKALDRILLRVKGTLLAQNDSVLLVDRVSEGGIPAAGAQGIKLPQLALDRGLLDALKQSGDVRWGAVEIVGWWQDGVLTPFRIIALNQQ